MKQIKTAVAILFMSGLSLTGCERPCGKPLSAGAEACRARIVAFRSNVGLNGAKLLRERREICEQTLSLTNAEERIVLFREFVKEFYKIDISKCTVREAGYMLDAYYPNSEYLAYCLIKTGGSEEEAWQSLMMGLERYRQMCFAYGDEKDMSDGKGREASDRRRMARWGREHWKGCLRFCRDTTIKSVFGTNKDTVERLQSRLEKKFGKIEERRPNCH